MIFNIITRLIIINIAPIAELFCNWPLICNCLLLKVCVCLVRLTSNRMFGSGDFWDKSSSWFLKILKLPSFHSSNFKFFKNALGQFIQNCPPKHVITCTKLTARATRIFSLSVLWHVYCNLWLHSAYEFSVFINLYLLGTVSNHLTGKTWSIN